MPQRTLKVERRGRVEYGASLEIQKQTERAVLTGAQPDTLLLLEHPHVLTMGRRSAPGAIIAPDEVLQARGVTVFETNRGGKVTYHGLGQVIGYPIINLSPAREDVHRYVRELEEVLIRTMSNFGIESFRIPGLTGVHTSRGKVAAIGVHIARWITTHGFALNVNTDLSYFDLIVACEGEPVTSMKELLGREIEISAIEDRIIERFAEVFEMELDGVAVVADAALPPDVRKGFAFPARSFSEFEAAPSTLIWRRSLREPLNDLTERQSLSAHRAAEPRLSSNNRF